MVKTGGDCNGNGVISIARYVEPGTIPSYNGTISGAFGAGRGQAFRNGELFVATANGILRFTFDGNGNAVSNGTISLPTSSVHNVAVSSMG